MTPIRVFISSTWIDLQEERDAVDDVVRRLKHTEFTGMEYFGARDTAPLETSLDEVEKSNIYIGIIAHRYGSGITENEYRKAKQMSIPCLIYFKDEKTKVLPDYIEKDPEKNDLLRRFKDDLKNQNTVVYFSSPDDLAKRVAS